MATRSQLKHAIRAACAIIQQPGVIIIGSQSVLATWQDTELPEVVTRSMELDICPLSDDQAESLAMVLDGAIGELSPFHNTFGFYIDGVGRNTAILPDDFASRLVAVSDQETKGYVGFCIDPHDLCVAKLAAGRDKDLAFVDSLINHRFVDPQLISQYLENTVLPQVARSRISSYLQPKIEFWEQYEVRALRPHESLGLMPDAISDEARAALTKYIQDSRR